MSMAVAATHYRVALVGNPNAGKSTLFNALTGGQQHVGNWPGKTVDLKAGDFTVDGITVHMIDLPGTYSLTAYSMEEIITRDYLIETHPDLVVAVVDAANLERNLYLVVQLLELGVPLLVALNMIDIAEGREVRIDYARLAKRLGAPVVTTVATRRQGLESLKHQILTALQGVTPAHYPTSESPNAHDRQSCSHCG